jgi:glycosidase
MLWAELKYEPEHGEPVEFNHDLFAHYKKLIAIRNAAPTLQLGTIKTLLTNDEAGIFAFVRQHDHREAMVILNNSETVRQVKLPVQGVFADLLNGERNLGSSFEVKPLWGRILQPV